MTRHTARVMFALGIVLSSVLATAAFIAVLSPHDPAEAARPAAVPIASLDALPPGKPVRVSSTFLAGLDLKAARIRNTSFGKPRGSVRDLPVFLVRDGDEVRGFIGIDPRNGCDIELLPARTLPWGSFPTMLHDICHGSIYNFFGQRIGGPSPWSLDELVITVRDGKVYAATDKVIAGRWVAR